MIPTSRSVLFMTQQRSEETRKQIMIAAVELLCRQGYEAASVAEICKSAGVSKGAFYHHFPSKQKLFLSILDKWMGELDTQLMSFRSPEKNIPQTIQDMADAIGSVFTIASGQLPMFMEFMVQASRDKVIWDAAIEPYSDYQDKFAGLIEEGYQGRFFQKYRPTDCRACLALVLYRTASAGHCYAGCGRLGRCGRTRCEDDFGKHAKER